MPERTVRALRRNLRLFTVFAALAVLASFAVSALVWVDNFNDNQRQDDTLASVAEQAQRLDAVFAEFQEERTQARLTGCNEANRDREAFNRTLVSVVTPQAGRAPRTPEQAEFIHQFLMTNLRPLRICTAEGIDEYFATNGAQGVRPVEVPDIPVATG